MSSSANATFITMKKALLSSRTFRIETQNALYSGTNGTIAVIFHFKGTVLFVIDLKPGGGGSLTCQWYGVVPFLGYFFHDRVRIQIYGYGFQQFFTFSVHFLQVKVHLLVTFFCMSGFMGMISRKFSGFMGILFRNFSGFMGGTFVI